MFTVKGLLCIGEASAFGVVEKLDNVQRHSLLMANILKSLSLAVMTGCSTHDKCPHCLPLKQKVIWPSKKQDVNTNLGIVLVLLPTRGKHFVL